MYVKTAYPARSNAVLICLPVKVSQIEYIISRRYVPTGWFSKENFMWKCHFIVEKHCQNWHKIEIKINATVQLNKLENTKKTVSFTINKNKNWLFYAEKLNFSYKNWTLTCGIFATFEHLMIILFFSLPWDLCEHIRKVNKGQLWQLLVSPKISNLVLSFPKQTS